jgi:aryl-alcohol dehydrogenase-like predicted oxidoreductase
MQSTLSTSPIKYRTWSSSNWDSGDIKISEVGLGCASAWGQPWFDEVKAIEIVRRALELGVTVFDTGPSYSRGFAEPRLAKAIKGIEIGRLLISTKVGTHLGNKGIVYHDLTRQAILESVDASRRRLALDVIPLLYLHGPRISELDSQLLDTLAEMRDRGWVRWYGVNSFDIDVLELLADIAIFDVVMLDYNVLKSSREPTITKLTQSGKLVVAGAAMANHLYAPGFLWPKSRADVWYSPRVLKNYRRDFLRARRFASFGTCDGWTPAQVALAFVLSNDQVGTAMFGTTRLQHLEENIAACGLTLPDLLVKQIRS